MACARVKRTGSGAVFARARRVAQGQWRLNANGQRGSENERQEGSPHPQSPTQAKERLEWATRPVPRPFQPYRSPRWRSKPVLLPPYDLKGRLPLPLWRQLRSAVVPCRLRTSECRLRKGLLWARSFWGMHLFWNPSERLSSDQQGKRAVPLRRNLWLKFVDCSKLASVVETVSSSVQVAGVVQQQIPQRVAFCTGEIVRFRIDPCGTRSS